MSEQMTDAVDSDTAENQVEPDATDTGTDPGTEAPADAGATEDGGKAARPSKVQRLEQEGADPAHQVEHTLTLEHAYRALAALDDHQREVVTLRFLSGLSLRETALALGKSEDAIKAQIGQGSEFRVP